MRGSEGSRPREGVRLPSVESNVSAVEPPRWSARMRAVGRCHVLGGMNPEERGVFGGVRLARGYDRMTGLSDLAPVVAQRAQGPSVTSNSEYFLRLPRTDRSNPPSACSCSGDVSPLAPAQ